MLAKMYGVPDGLRYCPHCHRATPVVLDTNSGAAVCTECTFGIGTRPAADMPADVQANWLTLGDDGAGRDSGIRAATIACSTPPILTATADGGAVTAAPRMRGAVVPKVRGDVAPKMRAAIAGSAARNDGFQPIDDIADKLGVAPAVRARAKEVIRKLEEAKAAPKGRNRTEAFYLACVQAACRAMGSPRTLKELAAAVSDGVAAKREIGRFIQLIKNNAAIDEVGGDGGNAADCCRVAVVRAGDYLLRFGSVLGMGDKEVGEAEAAARRLEDNLDVRRNPQSIAAAVIYMAAQRAGTGKTTRDVSVATGVGEATIKEAYRELRPHEEMLFAAQ